MDGHFDISTTATNVTGFIAVVVVAIILISVSGVDPTALAAVADVGAAYLALRLATGRPDAGAAAAA